MIEALTGRLHEALRAYTFEDNPALEGFWRYTFALMESPLSKFTPLIARSAQLTGAFTEAHAEYYKAIFFIYAGAFTLDDCLEGAARRWGRDSVVARFGAREAWLSSIALHHEGLARLAALEPRGLMPRIIDACARTLRGVRLEEEARFQIPPAAALEAWALYRQIVAKIEPIITDLLIRTPAWLNRPEPEIDAALRVYGAALSLAAQAYDDLLDLREDLAEGQVGAPLLLALEADADGALEAALRASWGAAGGGVEPLLDLIRRREGPSRTVGLIQGQLDEALEALEFLRGGPGISTPALEALAAYTEAWRATLLRDERVRALSAPP